jgi:hypothetical protein
MKILRVGLLICCLCGAAVGQDRFEAGGHLGYGGFLEDENSGKRPLVGGHVGVRIGETRSLLFEYTQFRRSGDFGYRQRHNFFGLALHTEPRPWDRVRVWTSLGAGAGVRKRDYAGDRFSMASDSKTFVAAHFGVGMAIDVGSRGFIRPGVRAYVWAPGVALGLAPVITAGFRF